MMAADPITAMATSPVCKVARTGGPGWTCTSSGARPYFVNNPCSWASHKGTMDEAVAVKAALTATGGGGAAACGMAVAGDVAVLLAAGAYAAGALLGAAAEGAQ